MSPSDPCPSPFRAPIGATGGLGHGSRLSPRRGWKRLLLTCLRVLGLTPSLYYTSLALVPGALGCLTRPGLAGTDSETASALAPGPNVFHAHARSDIRCIPSQSVCGPGGSLRPGVLT